MVSGFKDNKVLKKYGDISYILNEIYIKSLQEFKKNIDLQEEINSLKADLENRFESNEVTEDYLENFNLDCSKILKNMILIKRKELNKILNKRSNQGIDYDDINDLIKKFKRYNDSDLDLNILLKDYQETESLLSKAQNKENRKKYELGFFQRIKTTWPELIVGTFLGLVISKYSIIWNFIKSWFT